jgi:mediator of RNA polymerase II transcription subunit 4
LKLGFSREMIENIVTQKNQKIPQLVELLVGKDETLKETLELAEEQAKIQQTMNDIQAEVEVQDREIAQLQKQLKEAEQILSTAIFQARQKLASIAKSNKKSVQSEELIKFAHRISLAMVAPLNWQQGDLRRPYPTDIEMRLGVLGRSADLSLNGTNSQNQASMNDLMTASQNQFHWSPYGELHMSMGTSGGSSVSLDTRAHKDNSQDDEVMSTDSSSSSSSDSQ